jgi:high-affinity Fe2+/Pb2+ permease
MLTALWIGGVLVVLWWLWTLAWEGWAEQVDGEGSRTTSGALSVALLALVGVAVGGPLLTALVAWRVRRPRAAAIQGALAVVLAATSLPVLVAVLRGYADQRPPSTPAQLVCQLTSGGGHTCPGG